MGNTAGWVQAEKKADRVQIIWRIRVTQSKTSKELQREMQWLSSFFNEVTEKELRNCAIEIIKAKKQWMQRK